jgi:hypothetical protein
MPAAHRRDADRDRAQAEYYLRVLVAQWQTLEIEIAERCSELHNLPAAAQASERARNIRRLIRVKETEVTKLKELCASLAERADSR